MERIIVCVWFLVGGMLFVLCSKRLAVRTQHDNKKYFRLSLPLQTYEKGFRVGGCCLILAAVLLLFGVKFGG